MDTLESAVNLLSKGCWMSSVDIRHAYHTVNIAEEHQKFLRFEWKGKFFQYTCLPFGLSSAPRIFTKLLKPVFATLRSEGCSVMGYIDDCLILGDTREECLYNTERLIELLQKLGFVINFEKSVLEPTNRIEFLGHILDSEHMIIELPEKKRRIVLQECKKLYNHEKGKLVKIRTVARVIGLIVSSFSAVDHGLLHYRELEKAKSEALRLSQRNFDAKMAISQKMKNELKWWILNIDNQIRHISHGKPFITIQTDASLQGWGASMKDQMTDGRWTDDEKLGHINSLEMLAILYGLKSFENILKEHHIKILCDNTTAVSYINKMGGVRSNECNQIAQKIWTWCQERNIWLTCSHIAGKLNTRADQKSRKFNDHLEWCLNKNVFDKICRRLGYADIDLFATRLNCQIEKYCSWEADPNCQYVDAFTVDWGEFSLTYLFPPFSILNRCLRKMREDKAEGIMIAPLWPTQVWFTDLMSMVIDAPVIIKPSKSLLKLPHTQTVHPLWNQMTLIACRLSGDPMKARDFRNKLLPYSCHHGNQVLKNNTKRAFVDGNHTVVKGKLMRFSRL